MKLSHRRIPFLIACSLVAGCYTYRPVQAPSPGMDVRAQLTADAAVRRSQGLDSPILHYDGKVVAGGPDTLALDVLVARGTSAFQVVEIRDTVRLGNAEVQGIMGRKFSAVKSVLVAVGAGAAAFAIVRGIDQIVGGTGDDGGDPPPGARIPVLKWVRALLDPAHSRQ